LDHHPEVYKVVLVASHLFRASSMFALMKSLTMSDPLSVGIMVGASLLYRASIERFCQFRFTLPSLIGGGVMWAAHRIALPSFAGSAIRMGMGGMGLVGYFVYIVSLSCADIERYQRGRFQKTCCC
jgi:hypothetical protein